ncbi:MAG: TonB-dependent receptor [Cyclobacteriaceae bacterium]|jgi:iron complex outermembrane receptor protein|nr:TonB-dependent receptor [Cyclobacteriaceae bacterium]
MSKFYLYLSRYATVLFLLLTCQAYAQTTVSGRVTAADDGSGLPGVNVLEKGTQNGTVTNADGSYTITVGSNATLVFSFVGYITSEVAVGTQSTIDIALQSDVTALTEVVVVGYGTQEKKEITSAVTSVKETDFNRGTVNDPRQLLQGKVAGLNITRPGGDPNGTFAVRLRGVSTFGANTEPLVVIDGVIGGSLDTVDPNDIASIDILKDASAAAIYGTRGGSGVVLVTTKSGRAGRMTVEYNGSVAAESIANTIDVMSADEYRQVPGARDLGSSTDWLDVVTRTGHAQVHNLSVGGGTGATNYRVSFNYRAEQGVGLRSGFDQINARLNLSQKALNDRATFTLGLSTTTKDAELGFSEAFNYAIIANPTMPIYDNTTDSPTAGANYGGYAERDIFDFYNPLSIVEQAVNDESQTRLLVSLRAEYDFSDIVEGLTASAFYSQQRENDWGGGYVKKTAKIPGGQGRGFAGRGTDIRFNHLFETTLNYNRPIGTTDLTLLGGYSYQYFFNEGFGMSGGNFLTDAYTYNNLGDAIDFQNGLGDVGSYANSNTLVAFFGRANLNFANNYFLSVSARYEGSSRFGANNKWGLFPAVSAGVTLSNLMSIPAVNSLKLRASYGVTGNQPSDSYISLQRFGGTGFFYYNGGYVPSYGPVSNPNPDLAWETKSEFDVGADFTMFDNRLTGTIDYYIRNTKDLLVAVNVPVPPNLFRETVVNIGEIENQGLEFAFNYAAISKANFTWETGINWTNYLSNKIVSLTSGELSFGEGGVLFRAGMGSPGQNETELVRIKEGEEFGQLWGPVKEGVNDDGTPKFADLNGDGSFCDCDDDRTVIGNGMPKFQFGWTNTFTLGNWDLNVFLRGTFGHDLLNSYRGFYENLEPTTVNNYNIVKTKYYDPAITKAVVNSSHVEDAWFIRLDNASLGYTIPVTGAVNRLRLYFAAQNLFTITDYTGIDPEVRYADAGGDPLNPQSPGDGLSPGIERRSTYFTTRVFTFGVNLGF